MTTRFFTALLLALNTMPVLAATTVPQGVTPGPKGCTPEAETLSDGKCSCEDAAREHKKTWVLNQSDYTKYDDYIAYNPKTGDCVEWIKISGISDNVAKCEHYGDKYGPNDNNTHPGQCFLIANENHRTLIRALVKTYNDNYNALNSTPSRLIYDKGKKQGTIITLTNDTTLAARWVNGSTLGQSQPSVNAIISGYKTICRKNNTDNESEKVEYDFKPLNAGDYTQYVCVETSRIKKSQQTPKADTSKLPTGTGNSGNDTSGNNGSLVTTPSIKTLENGNKEANFIVWDAEKDQQVSKKIEYKNDTVYKLINKFVNTYNMVYESYRNNGKDSSRIDNFFFTSIKVDQNSNNTYTLKSLYKYGPMETAITGYKKICDDAQGKGGISTSQLYNYTLLTNNPKSNVTFVECQIECENGKPDSNGRCPQSKQTATTVSNDRAGTSNTLTQQTQNQQQQTINQSYLQELKDKLTAFTKFNRNIRYNVIYKGNVTTEQETWKNNCIKIISQIPGAKLENAPQIKEENGEVILTCVVTCEDPNAHIVDKQCKCNTGFRPNESGVCIKQTNQETPKPDPIQEETWKPDFAEPILGNSITVPNKHMGDDIVSEWIKKANAAIVNAGGKNNVIYSTSEDPKTITCKITECDEAKGYKKQPVDEKTCVCDDAKGYVLKDDKCVKLERENLETLKANTTGIDVAGVKAEDVNISANTPTPTETDLNKSKCEDGKNGTWDPKTQKCSCADGKEIALDNKYNAVCPTEKEMLYICEKSKNGFFDPETQKCSCADGTEIDLNGDDVCPEGTEEPAKKTPAATKITYSGIVLDADTKEPLSDANIFQAGNTDGETTDSEGKFTYETTDPVVTVSYTGYETITYRLNQGANIIELKETQVAIDEVRADGQQSEQSKKCVGSGGKIVPMSEGSKDFKCDCSAAEKVYNPETFECEDVDDDVFNAIVKAFKDKAEELKKQDCTKQCENAG